MLSDILKGKDHRKFNSLLQAMTWFQLLLSSALLAISSSAPPNSLCNAFEAPGTAVMFCDATLWPQTHETCLPPSTCIPYKVPSSRSHKLGFIVTSKIPGFRLYSLQLC